MCSNLASADYSFAVFDCDGVILDSNPIKTEAFRQALPDYPKELVENLVKYHRQHGGISRYEKFRYFFESLESNEDEHEYDLALERFQSYCSEQLLQAKLVPGVREFLKRLAEKKVPMHIVSGSDQAELREVLRHKGLLPFFGEVLGSPTSKRENLTALLHDEQLGTNGVFFGDALLDYQIASESGLGFVFVHGYSDWEEGINFCDVNGVECVADFTELTLRD